MHSPTKEWNTYPYCGNQVNQPILIKYQIQDWPNHYLMILYHHGGYNVLHLKWSSKFYQSFKIATQINPQLLSLDDFYSLLCSKETVQLSEQLCSESIPYTSLTASRTTHTSHNRGQWSSNSIMRGRYNFDRGHGCQTNITCHIYEKSRHTTNNYCHWTNLQYSLAKSHPQALLASI